MSKAFTLMATITASTKRPPAISSGKRGAIVENIASLACFPIDPITAEIAARMGIATPHEVLHTFVEGGLDIQEGDTLVVGSTEYPIKGVEDWDWDIFGDSDFQLLLLEELKSS